MLPCWYNGPNDENPERNRRHMCSMCVRVYRETKKIDERRAAIHSCVLFNFKLRQLSDDYHRSSLAAAVALDAAVP
jgi:hypothetical protein